MFRSPARYPETTGRYRIHAGGQARPRGVLRETSVPLHSRAGDLETFVCVFLEETCAFEWQYGLLRWRR